MEPDGSNQKQLTFYKSDTWQAAASPDGTKLAYITLENYKWWIRVQSLETGGRLPFYNLPGSQNATPSFTRDGKRILFSTNTVKEGNLEIYIANTDGRDMTRLTFNNGAVDSEPRVNPKTGNEVVFVSDRSGMPQVYMMSITGADVQRLTDGSGEAVNPAWHTEGQHIAFAWTKGFAPGNYNIFLMDVATRELVQLTHGAGRNENPTWAPDGRHIVFSSNRNGGDQIWTMLADGTQLRQLTTQGRNQRPVWK